MLNPLVVTHCETPLQRSPSSNAAQSLSVLHWQIVAPGLHVPLLQLSPAVHGWPSSHGLPVAAARSLQAPVAGWHWLVLHAVSAAVGQLMVVAGLTMHWPDALLQNSVPLHMLPSSFAAQSASAAHWHTLAPGLHTPFWHASPAVHALPSLSQVVASGRGTPAHWPVFGLHTLSRHWPKFAGQSTTVLGLTAHNLVAKLQYSVPLHRLPSSFAAQSALLAQLQISAACDGLQLPAEQLSPTVHGLPSSHATPSLAGTSAQLPVFGSQVLLLHAWSGPVVQVTIVAGLMLHSPVALLQK